MEKVGPTGKGCSCGPRRSDPVGCKEVERRPDIHVKEERKRKQFIFNDNVKDQFLATEKHLDNMELTMTMGCEALEKIKRELEQGLQLITS